MPWTAKQLRLFRAAAHDPKIARSSGIKRKDARRMMHEGLKKASGGMIEKQGVAKRDTRHGLLDLPVHVRKKMKKPKMRFADGGTIGSQQLDAEKDAAVEAMKRKYGIKPTPATSAPEKKEGGWGSRMREMLSPKRREKEAGMKKGGVVKCRDGCVIKGKTRGRMV